MEIPKSYDSSYFILDRTIDHSSIAKKNNIWQFQGRDNIEKLIDVLLNQLTVISSDTTIIQKGLSVEQGTDWLLDLVGKSLQVYRGEGQSDAELREDIVQKIVFDSSQGTINDVSACATFMLKDVEDENNLDISIVEGYPATVITQVPFENLDRSNQPLENMQRAVCAGVKSTIHVHPQAEERIFSFDVGGGGFSATGYPTLNGALAANFNEPARGFAPFSLDGVTVFGSKGLGATDAPEDALGGNFVALETFYDATGDGIPDTLYEECIRAINYTI